MVVNMVNPIDPPGKGGVANPPLCPWQEKGHEKYYVDVDATGDEYARFCEAVNDLSVVAAGRGFLVSGETGVGKTSLLNRCAAKLDSDLRAEGRLNSVVFDLKGRVSRSASASDRAGALRRRFLRRLAKEEFLIDNQLNACREIQELSELVEVVSEYLEEEGGKALTVLLPQVERRDHCAPILSAFLRPYVVPMAETASQEVVDFCKTQHGAMAEYQITRLRLGVLSREDALAFIKSRLALAKARDLAYPSIDKRALSTFLNQRLAGSNPPTVKELYVLLREAFASAIKDKRDKVTFEDFTAFLVGRGYSQ